MDFKPDDGACQNFLSAFILLLICNNGNSASLKTRFSQNYQDKQGEFQDLGLATRFSQLTAFPFSQY